MRKIDRLFDFAPQFLFTNMTPRGVSCFYKDWDAKSTKTIDFFMNIKKIFLS